MRVDPATLGRAWLAHREAAQVPQQLRDRWVASVPPLESASDVQNSTFTDRLDRDRRHIIPWLDRTAPLADRRILEIGCGPGASTLAMTEQGARVTAVDVDAQILSSARRRLASVGLEAEFVAANAAELDSALPKATYDQVIFWASLEHMTLSERLAALRAAWSILRRGGLLTMIETPNRLWYTDSHTSRLPFYVWLPDELAYLTAGDSAREGFGDRYGDPGLDRFDEFLRRGRGFSYHEIDVALGTAARNAVVSSMQLDRRRRSLVRRAGWRLSIAGRYEAILHRAAPDLPRDYLQPFLYLTIERVG